MQNNGLIRLFAILFGLVSIYQLSFTFITSQKESQAKAFATDQYSEDLEDYIELRDRAVVDYLDSIGNAPIFGFTSYNDAKGKELNKGLDLKGGAARAIRPGAQSRWTWIMWHLTASIVIFQRRLYEA